MNWRTEPLNENSNIPSEVIHTEDGVVIFRTTASDFIKKLGADVMYVDFEDISIKTFTVGDDDWKNVPEEGPLEGKVVPFGKPKA